MLFQLGELKPFLPYTSLSAGEKILAIVLMTDLYDNIIISSVNHSDIVNKVKDYDVDHIEM